jgi:hypothetical protein
MKWLKRVLFVVVCLVTLYGLFVAVENWRGEHAWNAYQREREAKGDSFDWKSVTPPPVPDAENFAMMPLFAELFPKPPQHPKLDALRLPDCAGAAGDWHMGRVENLAAWKKCFTNDDLLAALKVYEPMMREISEALVQRPKCRFPVRYEDHVNALLPHLAQLRSVARVYRLRALAELSARQTDAAFEDVRLCLRLADTIKDEPTLISFLVRAALLDMAVQPIWEGLAAHRWNERQLAAWQAEFANADQLAGFARAMRGERLFGYNAVRWLMQKPSERLVVFNAVAETDRRPLLGQLLTRAIPTGWWYQNLLTLDRFYTETYWPALDIQRRRLDPPAWLSVEHQFRKKSVSPYNVLSRLMLPAISNCAKTAAAAQATVDEVVVACALERCRLAKGALPDKLDALVPEFLAKVPTDVITGEPLRYRRDGERFTLWSVGWNQKDDGGLLGTTSGKTPRWDKDKGDWVFAL